MTSASTTLSNALRLGPSSLHSIPAAIQVPRYDRTRIAPGIVHLGLGAFFRAHGAEYIEDVLAIEPSDWGIVGVSLQRPDQRDRLVPQSGLYTLLERAGGLPRTRIVGSVLDILWAGDSIDRIIAHMAAPTTAIVSLTITEKGYCHDPATGRLQASHPQIRHDLEHSASPQSAIGLIVAALARRRAAGLGPFTVLCCDNLPGNGHLVSGLVHDFAALGSDALATWISRTAAFPSTMVDRIVPSVTAADLSDAISATGLRDEAPVSHEPFRQWVIEDCFVDGRRPAWERAGAELVADVTAHEHMKLMLLNGSHSALAYLGYLGGHETIGDCVADRAYESFLRALWREEICPVVPAPPGIDLSAYTASLLTRYANPAIRHRTWQIAMDGSQKLPQRILKPVRLRLERGLAIDRLALVVAGWMVYVSGIDEQGRTIDVRDPRLPGIRTALATSGEGLAGQVGALLSLQDIFGADLAAYGKFVAAVSRAYETLRAVGARRAISALG